MAVTRTTRFSLHRWDSGSDPINREQSDADNLQVETLAGIFRLGLDSNKGSASSASLSRSLYYATDTSTLYFSDGTNWVTLNSYGAVGDIQSLTIGGSASAGSASTAAGVTTQKFALANHIHAFPASGTPVSIGTANSAGSASTISRSDHVHLIGAGAINSSSMFSAGVVDTAAIATSGVTTNKISDSSVTTAKIADSGITTAKIADSNVTTAKIASNAVTAAKLNADTAGSGLSLNGTSNALDVNVDGSTLEISTDTLRIKDSGVTTAKIADSGVTTIKIASAAVTASKIAADVAGNGLSQAVGGALEVGVDGSTIEISSDALRVKDSGISSAKIAGGAVTTAKLDTTATSEAVTTATIRDLNVTTAKIADSAVTTVKIADSNVTTIKIADSNVTTIKIADSNVTTAKIADSAVTTAKIADANITAGKLASNAVTAAKLNSDTAGSGLSLNGVSNALDVNVDGSTLEINTDTLRIKDAGVTAAKIAAAVAGDGLSGGAGSALAVNVDNSTIEINADTLRIKDGGVGAAKIGSNAVTAVKLNADTAGSGLSLNGVSNALDVNVDGSTIEINADTLRIKDSGVITAKIADSNVTTAKIADSNVTTAKIADSNVTTGKLAANAVTGSKAGAGTYRNGTNTDTGGTIYYGTVSAMNTATGSTAGFSNGDMWFGY